MWSRNAGGASAPSAAAALLLTFVVGCTPSDAPTSPPAEPVVPTTLTAAQQQAAAGRGLDAEFTRLAQKMPGFGGMYYDRNGRLHVYVKAPQGADALRSTDVVGELRRQGGPAVQRRLSSGTDVVTVAAKYDYQELQAYRARLARLFRIPGVVYTDTDEARNRVGIALAPGASEGPVLRELDRAGVPRDAVVITRMSPIKAVKTLRDRFRPVPGGVQIVFPAPSEGPGALFVCSVGFNARLASRPDAEFFVTASHCSDIQGGEQNTPYFQPDPFTATTAANRIAREFRDPQYGNPGGLCVYEGARCRLSDALLARYTDPDFSQFGKIARTTFSLTRIGSLEIDPDRPRWQIVGEFEFPFLGEEAHKVGRSSGWTRGPVIATCVDVGVNETDIVQICQDIVLAGVRGGDSGSGVFERVGNNQIVLVGILWGGGDLDGAPVFVFSAMENIEHELGPLITSPGGEVMVAAN
jgi:hypothetical protein